MSSGKAFVFVYLIVMAAGPARSKEFTCATCHPAQAGSQPHTSMARALLLPSSNTTLLSRPKLAFQQGPYSYTIETRDNRITYSVTDGKSSLSVPISWTFGVGSQTYVFERNGKLYESFVSYYPKIDGLDVTMGDQRISPDSLEAALGRELTDHVAQSCFGCHATGAVAEGRLQLDSLQPGVQCEHCHAGASKHVLNISRGSLESLPRRLGNMSAEDTSNFCGQCHRSWETVVRNGWRGEINVRFQPYRLANSKCFDGLDKRISCTGCHDPHVEIVRDDKTYDSKCLACHSAGAKPSASLISAKFSRSTRAAVNKVCPKSNSNCVSCHMPKVDLPGGHQTFTDHEIRVTRPNEPYPD